MPRIPRLLRRGRRRLVLAGAASALTAAVLSACGGGDPDGFGDADTGYAADLTVHHAQTLQVLDLSLGRERLDPALGRLADDTRQALFDEVGTTQKLLKRWEHPVPRTALQHTHSENHDYDTSIPGVLSAEDVHRLERTGDADFQRAWLSHLITLEEGAVELAEQAVEDAQNAELTAFAKRDLAAHRDRLEQLRRYAGS